MQVRLLQPNPTGRPIWAAFSLIPSEDEDEMAEAHNLIKWQSHKTVHAAKIIAIVDEEMTLEGANGNKVIVIAAPNMFSRYQPVVGDYYVVYDDGYASISPRQTFESGYHRF